MHWIEQQCLCMFSPPPVEPKPIIWICSSQLNPNPVEPTPSGWIYSQLSWTHTYPVSQISPHSLSSRVSSSALQREILQFFFYYFPVTGCEKYWPTRPGLKPGPPESRVKCITNWAIWHQYLYQSDRHIPKRVLLRLASSFEKLANYI